MQGCVVQVTIEKLLAYCILHTFSRAVGRGKDMVGQVSSDPYFLEPYINQGADYNHGSKSLTQALNETEKSEDTNNSSESGNKTSGAIYP